MLLILFLKLAASLYKAFKVEFVVSTMFHHSNGLYYQFYKTYFDAFVIRAILTKTFDNEMIDMRNIMTCYKGT